MVINPDKKQKEVERVYIAPNFRPFLALTLKEDTDVEDEFEIASEDGKKRKKVQQTIKGNVFTTEIVYEQEMENGGSMREESKITYVLNYGTRLIWEDGDGYIATTNAFQTMEEIEEVIDTIK